MNTFWKILELEETKDLNEIKNAYRTKLLSVNPEDDTEGFKELRTAYETALGWANSSVLTEKETEEDINKEASPVGEWMNMVREIYANFSKRVDEHSWEILMKEEVCIHLDTCNEVKDALLTFLMDHFRLPHKVYKVLDDFFHFVEEKKELYEKYPGNFIDFIERSVLNEDFLNYSLFDGEEEADYDAFISCYYELKGCLEEGDTDKPKDLISRCKDFFIYHPYLLVEEARFHVKKKEFDKAAEILMSLHKEYQEDVYILYFLAEILHMKGDIEEAIKYFEKLLVLSPNHYSGKLGVADCLYNLGEYEKSKEHYINILDTYPSDNYGNEGMMKVNEILIEKYKVEYTEHPEKLEIGLELGWCLYQNLRYQECIVLLDNIKPDEEHNTEYCNLLGRSLLYHDEYERALLYLPIWLKGLENITDTASEELKIKKKRIGYANYTISNAYYGLAEETKENNGKGSEADYLNKALEYVLHAVEKEKEIIQRLAYQNQKTRILFQLERYEACVDECDKIIQESESYYPAIVCRQEAYFKLEHFQNVIDDFRLAVGIYSKDAKPYLLAVKTYMEFDRYEDALLILKQAEENQVTSNELTLLKVKALRCTAKSEEDTKNAYHLLYELLEKVKNDTNGLERTGDLWFESALCYKDLHQLSNALDDINLAIRYNPSESDYIYCKGNILFEMENFKDAQNIYNILLKNHPDNSNVLFKLGRTFELLKDRKSALDLYLRVLKLNAEHSTVNHYIAEIYENMGEEEEDSNYIEKALGHRNKQIEVNPNDYYYIERGLTLAELERFYDAIEDYKRAIEINTDSPYPYNNIGILYKYQEQYEEAITYYKEAIKHMNNEKTSLPYNNMASCYIVLGQYELAEECYKENLKLFPGKESSYTLLAQLYRRMKLFDKAVSCYQEAITSLPKEKKADLLVEIAETYEESKNEKKALYYYKNALRNADNYAFIYKSLGGFYFYSKSNYRKAIKYYKKALEIFGSDSDETIECLYAIGEAYYYQGNKKKSEEAANNVLNLYYKKYNSTQKYVSFNGFEAARCFNIGRIYILLGNVQKAKELFERMTTCRKCNSCKYKDCFEAIIGKGMISEREGNIKKAVSYYNEALSYDVNNSFCRYAIRRLEKFV
jgi:tetratricopeptide (TPR) repeat protein